MESLAKYSIFALLVINLILVLSTIVGKYLYKQYESEARRSSYIVYLIFLFGFYLLFLTSSIFLGLFAEKTAYTLIFIIFLIIPFVIGKHCTLEKVKLFTNLQILVLIASCLTSLQILIKI